MYTPDTRLLDQLENSRKAYQAALIELRLAEDTAKELTNGDGAYSVSSARGRFRAATREYQEALRAFTEFALSEAGKRSKELGAGS
jgi:hypothetical protein